MLQVGIDTHSVYGYAPNQPSRSRCASTMRTGHCSVKRPVASNWERIVISGEIAGESEYVRCCVEIPAACAVDVYGPQLEAQVDASGYRKNTDLAGVYTARFDQDEFGCVSNGPDNHAVRLQVVTVRGVTS